jgi:DNA-binding response OmpR family regulator
VYDRSIDVQIGRQRKKIAVGKSHGELIRTERGAGYTFTAEVETVR